MDPVVKAQGELYMHYRDHTRAMPPKDLIHRFEWAEVISGLENTCRGHYFPDGSGGYISQQDAEFFARMRAHYLADDGVVGIDLTGD